MTETRELICINCPLGCGLTVTIKDGEVEKNSYRWTYDDKEILLQEENTVMLYMEEVKSN